MERISRQYDSSRLDVDIRDARDADERDRVFFTPMLIVRDVHDADRKTIVVGDPRQPEVLTSVLAGHGIRAR